ncbi:MAG: GNAT family N-acetyltransferase [Chitinophagaceae bacterium]|nr:MAG: GNAT family N-acetyltransferase [Chitinophagaceae bacterium]
MSSRIIQSTPTDIDAIFSLYEDAVDYQKTKFNKHWLPFDRQMVMKEIEEGKQWKIMEGDSIACVFALAFGDPHIWGDKNADPSIYLHRIVTHSSFRGGGYVNQIISWAKLYGRQLQKKFIRMDTWGDNDELIEYYKRCGFTYLGSVTPEATDQLPSHYSSIYLALFEIKI